VTGERDTPPENPETPPRETPDSGGAGRPRARNLLLVFVAFWIVLVVAGGTVAIWGISAFDTPGPLAESRRVVIPKGAGLGEISRRLSAAGVVANPLLFRLGVQLFGQGRPLRAGEYRFVAAASPRQVMELLIRGETVLRRITLAEGLTTRQIFAQIARQKGLVGPIDMPPEEGRLLPETYYFALGDRRDALVRRMRDAMTRTLDELWNARAPDLPYKSKTEALILASIVEKETAVDGERPLIAGVFVNRLRKRMRLQSDPTIIYGLTRGAGPLNRPLRRSEIARPTPYNTYVIAGLPPGPIANPGRASIAAALKPARTRYLYFVADGSGGHAFARTNAEHLRNVAKWRRLSRQRHKNKP